MWAPLVFLSLASAVSSAPIQQGANGTVTVQIEDGVLRGKIVTSRWNKTYVSFQKIPFAQPPVGDLRFKSPKPVIPWTGVRDAIEAGPYCTQDLNVDNVQESEDCLYLNVYVPEPVATNPPTEGLTVLVWIHGGAYVYGAGIKDRPDNFMNHTIVLVTTNYRLGSLGFLALEHPEVTSNAGLKDLVAALRWVKRNIAQFGGNPNNVTIFGESVGGENVDFLQLTNMSKGLFHRAISQSGSIVAVDFSPYYNGTREAFRLGQALGYNGTNTTELVHFLRSVSAEDILKGHDIVATEEGAAQNELTSFPVVDAKIQEGDEVFLTDTPENLLRAGKVQHIPYIAGFNSQEGKAFAAALSQATLDGYNNNSELLVPKFLNLRRGTAESIELGAKIKNFYFGNKSVSLTDTLPELTNYVSDTFMIYNVYRGVKLHVNYGTAPIYMLEYVYQGTLENHTETTVEGPAHGDDVDYYFADTSPYSPNSDDLTVINHFLNIYVGFAKTGNPSIYETVEWTPATKTNLTYLQLNVELSLHQNPLAERMAFWDYVFENYRKV